MEKFFKLKENGTNVRTEIMAGLTTFFAMAYILFVNPDILSQSGMPWGAVFLATIIASIIGTLVMGLVANVPYAQAPGMGVNAFFTFTVMLGMGYSYNAALAMVFISGCLFILITMCSFREKIVSAIPKNIKVAISVGIGLFLAFIGFQDAGLVVLNQDTMVSMVDFSRFAEDPTAMWGAILSVIVWILYLVLVVGAGVAASM
jgi:AGZA family xanthine/uracil permease-like MFS transporter